MVTLNPNALIVLGKSALNTIEPILIDSSRRLVAVFVGSEGATVKQNATGALVAEVQGSEDLAIKQKASTGEMVAVIQGDQGADVSQDASGALISKIQGSEDIAIKQKASTGEMIAEMQGSEGVAVKQEATGELISVMQGSQNADILQDATGALVSLMKGLYGATPTTIAVDLNGNMVAVMKGEYGGSLQTISTDANGRISADFGILEQSTFDLDSYANGTDNRISFSSTITMDIIKYWINTQNSLIVIRRIDIQGSATLGTFLITFASLDVLAGSTGINLPMVDPVIYRKTIADSEFDYSTTNCTIKGFITDYLKNPDDISDDYAIEEGGATVINAYDDDLTTYLEGGGTGIDWTTYKTTMEVSFSSRSVTETHFYAILAYGSTAKTMSFRIQLEINSVWTDVHETITTSNAVTLFEHIDTEYDLVTGIRAQIKINNSGVSVNHKHYDLTVY